jgi:hypothetical protein
MKYKVTLSIGFVNGRKEKIIDVDDTELKECETEEEKEKLLDDYWQQWAWEHIDGCITEV